MILRVFLFIAAGLVARGQPLDAARQAEIEKAIDQAMSRDSIPGLSIAVAVDGELRWSNGYGLSDLENFVPAKAGTVYRLASISKPITAVAALQLWEEGRLDLDAPVQKYVSSFPLKEWPVTTRELLGHVAGIRHYRGAEMDSTRHYDDLLAPLRIFADDPLLFQPGSRYSYSTYGFVLAGVVVESASGRRFADYLKEHIFQPAGMDRIRTDEVTAVIPNRTRGYRRTATGEVVNCNLADTSNKIPGGGLASTAADLVKFALAVRRGALLKKETVEQMWTSLKTTDGKPTGYGLGWAVAQVDGKRAVSHSGGQQGTTTNLLLWPEDGTAVAVMANLEGAPSVARLCVSVSRILTGR